MLTSVRFSVYPYTTIEQIMEGHPSGVKRTRIRVIGVNFSDDLIKGKEF